MRRTVFPLLLALVAAWSPADQQTKNWRKELDTKLRELYPASSWAETYPATISKPGAVFVVTGDGIRASATRHRNIIPIYIVDGTPRAKAYVGDLRVLRKGERVYVTHCFTSSSSTVRVEIWTVDTQPVVAEGSTINVAYRSALMFDVGENRLSAMDIQDVKKLIDPFIQSEAEASAVQTKTIELGQTFDQVEAILGKPDTVAKLGSKTIYTYKAAGLKVIFTDGKVSDVQ